MRRRKEGNETTVDTVDNIANPEVSEFVNEGMDNKEKIRDKKIKDYSKKGKKYNIVLYIIGIIIFIASLALVGFCIYKLHELDMLPAKYFQLILLGAGAFELITAVIILARRSHVAARIIFCILAILVGAVCALGIKYLIKTTQFLDNVVTDNKNIKTFYVLVKADSEYTTIEQLTKKSMYYYNSELVDDSPMLDHVLGLVEAEIYALESNEELGKALVDGKVDSIVLEASAKTLLDEQLEGFTEAVKSVYSFELEEQDEDIAKEVESISTTPFVIYISGIDTWGSIASVSRSDVNMVAAINPETHQILLVSIPRDYYVQLHGTRGNKDKLTHAGIYGINMSVKTVEDLLQTDINYYMRVNFTSLIDIVNALGGVSVYAVEEFKTTYDGLNYHFNQGYNELDGWKALAFCRERKDFKLGDRMRGVNQAAVLSAIIKKACSYSVITRFEDLLAAVDGKFTTNMSLDSIRELVKYQLTSMKEWTITSLALNGADARAYTYAMGTNNLLYVMLPDDSQVQNARDKIDALLAGEALDGTLGEIKTPVVSNKYYQEIQAQLDKKAAEEAAKKAQEEADRLAQEEANKKDEEDTENGDENNTTPDVGDGTVSDGSTDKEPTTGGETPGGSTDPNPGDGDQTGSEDTPSDNTDGTDKDNNPSEGGNTGSNPGEETGKDNTGDSTSSDNEGAGNNTENNTGAGDNNSQPTTPPATNPPVEDSNDTDDETPNGEN